MKKRIFTLMLALCLVFAMMPVPAFAEGEVTEPITETAAPEETKKPEEPVVPEETKKPEESVIPEETKKSEEPVIPEETKKSEDPVIPEEGKKTEDPVIPEEGKKTEDPAIPEETKKPEEPTAAQKVQALIDALPETVTAENRAEVEAQLTAIDDAKEPLGDEERAALDFGKYDAAVAAINALDGMPGAEVPTVMEEVYQVTYNPGDDGTGNIATDTKIHDEQLTLKGAIFTRTGYTQTSWAIVENGMKTYDLGGIYTENAALDLYPVWTPNSYTASFDANGGEGTMKDMSMFYESSYDIKNSFTRTGYTFTGWNTQADGTGKFYPAQEYIWNLTTENGGRVTLYAQWQANTYTISFHANDGEGTMTDLPMTYDKAAKLTALGFTREGYRFTGWTTKADGTGLLFADEKTVSNLTSANGGTVDLYAQWVKVIDRVDLSLSGHVYDQSVEQVKVTTKDDILFPLDKYDDGWGITKDPNKLTSLSGQLFQADTQYYLWVTFYAKEGCVLEGPEKGNVFLDGRAAQAVEDAQGIVTVVFRLPVIYTVEASAGKNGTISPEGRVAVFEGEDVEIKITPNKGYVVYRLTVDGTNVKTTRTYTFKNVQESHTIHARFLKNGDNAKTGDSFPMATALGAVTLSSAALAALFFLRKRKQTR